jgi:hypothetical protein
VIVTGRSGYIVSPSAEIKIGSSGGHLVGAGDGGGKISSTPLVGFSVGEELG